LLTINSALAGENALGTNLSAREVQEAIEERISKGLFRTWRTSCLPVRCSIAVDSATSPSTVSRALIEMVRGGWLEVQERRFVACAANLPPKP